LRQKRRRQPFNRKQVLEFAILVELRVAVHGREADYSIIDLSSPTYLPWEPLIKSSGLVQG
jgi:hypothetical protein